MTNFYQLLLDASRIGHPHRTKLYYAMESNMKQQQLNRTLRTNRKHNAKIAFAIPVTALGLAVLLSGCSSGLSSGTGTVAPIAATGHVTGRVFGGQNPVSGATIQLYTVGTSGLKSASTGLIGSTVLTDSNGNFNLGGTYSCTGSTAGTQVYLVASGGNPGGGTNANLSLVAGLGSCANLLANAATTFITMNEVTTVAAAYALAPFAADLTHIGATGSNPTGLVNAFANAASLANTSYGFAGGASLPAGAVAPISELNTLGNIIASCVNTTGAASSACTTLFAATGATDTFGAALAIAKNPGGTAITSLYSLSSGVAPFQPSMTTAPNDFTVSLSYNGGGTFSAPYAIAIDATGDAWVTNSSGSTVTELSPTGSVLASPTASGLFGAEGIAVDKSGNVWVANTAGNSVIKFTLTSGSVTSTNSFTAGSITAPTALALDSNSNAFIANFNGNSVTELNSSGVNQNSSPFTGSSNNITVPTGIAVGSSTDSGAVYVTSGNGYVVKLSNTGAYVSNVSDSALQGPSAVVLNSSGQIGVTGFTTGSAVAGALGEFTDSGSAITVASASPVVSGLSSPAGVASDGTSFWIANSATSGSLAQFVYNSATPTSPTVGFGSLNTPVGVAVDPSGCVWTANSGSNTVSQFIGLAAPYTTPISANVGP